MTITPVFTPISASDSQKTLLMLQDAKAQNVAREFESIFTTMMLKSMRSAITPQEDENPFLSKSLGEKIYTEMLDEEYGKLASKQGTIGLANLILQQIQKNGAAAMPSLRMLKGLNNQPWMLDKQFIPSTGAAVPKDAAGQALGAVARWAPYISAASKQYGVDPDLIAAIITQESGGNPNAVSPKGAKGLMQLMDSTASDMGVTRPFSPQSNIMGGTKYLKQLLDAFNGDESLALASYNAGPAAVEQYNGIPPFDETKRYVTGVLDLRQRLSQSTAARKQLTEETQDGIAH